jgi:RND family efflux transporter MFP subunit
LGFDKVSRGNGKATAIFATLAIALVVMFALGYYPRAARAKMIQNLAETHNRELIEVSAAPVIAAANDAELILPGGIAAVVEAPIFARTDGYVRKRMVDIGDKVNKGQLLAEIDSPEVDQQLMQARASVAQNKATLGQTQAALQQAKSRQSLAAVTLRRWKELVAQGVLSKQEGDDKEAQLNISNADVAAAEANIKAAEQAIAAAEANVSRLVEIQGFQKVVAPYDGMITVLNVVFGTLVSSGSNSSIRELYRITQLNPLKIVVQVPQSEVPFVRVGQTVEFTVQELPGRIFKGHVERMANTLDAASRSQNTEIYFDNSRFELLPGSYAQVNFKTHRSAPPLMIPGDAVVTGKTGARVALLTQGSKIHWQPVQLGRDYGAQSEILAGLHKGDMVVLNPTDEIQDGMQVKVMKEAK